MFQWCSYASLLKGALGQMKSFEMKKFLKDESGATAIEYGLIAVCMALMLLVAAPPLAAAVSKLFGKVTTAVSTFQ